MKNIAIIVSVILLATSITSCKKGEDDPFISLRSRKARLVAEWNVEKETRDIEDGYSDKKIISIEKEDYKEVLKTAAISQTNVGKVSNYTFNLKRDGTFSFEKKFVKQVNGKIIEENLSQTGLWSFVGKIGELKNKEMLALSILTLNKKELNIQGFEQVVFETYSPDENVVNYRIKQLKNKEVVLVKDESGNFLDSDGAQRAYKDIQEITLVK